MGGALVRQPLHHRQHECQLPRRSVGQHQRLYRRRVGSITFYAWAKDAVGNVSAAKSATLTIPLSTAIPPVQKVSTLAGDGAYTNQATVNVSGITSDADGLESVIINMQAAMRDASTAFSGG